MEQEEQEQNIETLPSSSRHADAGSPCSFDSNSVSSTQGASSSSSSSFNETETPDTVVVRGKEIHLRRAKCKRASREGRPRHPGLRAFIIAKEKMQSYEQEFIRQGRTFLDPPSSSIPFCTRQVRTVHKTSSKHSKHASSSSSSSSSASKQALQEGGSQFSPTSSDEKTAVTTFHGKVAHLQTLKSRTADAFNNEPAYLLGDRTAELQFDRLLESSLRANAGSQAVTKRRATQGAANQTTRVNCRSAGMAAAVQCTNTSIVLSIAEHKMKVEHGISTLNPHGITSINPAQLCFCTPEQLDHFFEINVKTGEPEERLFPITATTELIYNSVASKLGTSSIRSAAHQLASQEISEHLISRSMYSDPMLSSLCHSIGGGYEIDAIWASIVLIVFLSHDPRGRRLLATSKLTDLDLQTAYVLECYGRAEITRRVRLLEQQSNEKPTKRKSKKAKQSKKAVVVEENDDDDDDDDDNDGNAANADADANELDNEGESRCLQSECQEEETKTLGTKRRRCSKLSSGVTSTSGLCESKSLIVWWFHALRSQQSSVLETLVASSRDTAKEAAKTSLQRQAGDNRDVISNKTLNGICVTTAVKSCEELVRLVHVPSRNIPKLVSIESRWQTNDTVSIGVLQIPSSANETALHACTLLRRTLQPGPDSKIVVAHSSAVQEFSARGSSDCICPGILERYCRLHELALDPKSNKRKLSNVEDYIQYETRRPLLSLYSGTTRSFISMQMSIPVTQSMLTSASMLCSEGVKLYERSKSQDPFGTSCSMLNSKSNGSSIPPPLKVIGTSNDDTFRYEPVCTPCSRLAIGIRINELLRRWMTGRSRKNGIAAVVCGITEPEDIPKDLGLIMDSEPLPMAIITEFKLRAPKTFLDDPNVKDDLASKKYTTNITMGASLNVCLEGSVRVPELVLNMDDVFERRAMMIVASSQASYIGDVGCALSAQWANCSSASSKKVSCADVNTLCLLSAWDCYAGGLTNVHRNYTNTVFSGTYGPHVDTGITSPGLLANYYRADMRQHGTVSLGQEAADKLCEVISESHYVPVGDSHYATSPVQTRGIPHGFVPGLHSVLNDYDASLETYRKMTDRDEEPTVDGVFVIPFGAFTQALAPDVESTVDLTIRHSFRDMSQCSVATGRSYLPDTTAEEEAIFVEPMWRRPCQVCASDNPFATSYGYADTMFNVCNMIALMVVDIGTRRGIHQPDDQLSYFHAYVSKAVFDDFEPSEDGTDPSLIWVADFLVLVFGCIYPKSHRINVAVVPSEVSVLASKVSRVCKMQVKRGANPIGASFSKLLDASELQEVKTLWAKFSKRTCPSTCAWNVGLKPLLTLLIQQRGSNQVSKETISKMRTAVDWVAKSAWLVYSKDGKSPPEHPNPLCECPNPQSVQRTHLDPVFCAQGEDLEVAPRGCLIGLLPFQLRQVYITLLGCHIQNVKPQVVRNEGGLNLRMSSAADILELDGKPRSEKAISPLQVEADSEAFGTRHSKLYGCSLQRSAWDRNALKLAPLFAALESPQSEEKRSRGEWGEASWLKTMLNEGDQNRQEKYDVETLARNQFKTAAKNSLDSAFACCR